MDVDQVEGENKDADNTLETTALFVTQYIQSTSTSLRKDLYKLLPFFCQFVGKNFGFFTGYSFSEYFILSFSHLAEVEGRRLKNMGEHSPTCAVPNFGWNCTCGKTG